MMLSITLSAVAIALLFFALACHVAGAYCEWRASRYRNMLIGEDALPGHEDPGGNQ